MTYWGLHNKSKAAVHSAHKLTGPKKKKKSVQQCVFMYFYEIYFIFGVT